MISYKPLRDYLEERGKTTGILRDKVIHRNLVTKINEDKPVSISTIETICLFLKVPIEKVVRIVPDDVEN
ncbi:helix-turn-helix domain-containing protein [Bacillus velezensis]|uniref:helix-turn-helix domain-containing protein n=1 Tax=Bacillus velezensis TaxID=492670 RepID=UPI0009F3CE91|nr:helix-turn-helix transcriptional regulator [Bacillus velezensis]OQV53347.1 XRE family transcriptional regulator [Bacillus velezensis]OQV55370.1 XRE family transcriptional regulator [Bacillus velezensis]OQV60861.1 XRE family transcriptional regulator [Bacillus velezensis]OQV61928.1 XRE family transcriptional regulator [Bacillus velezensis]